MTAGDLMKRTNLVPGLNMSWLQGDRITYTCDFGYHVTSGDLHRLCMSNGRWSGMAPACEGQCLSDTITGNCVSSIMNIKNIKKTYYPHCYNLKSQAFIHSLKLKTVVQQCADNVSDNTMNQFKKQT